MRAKPAGAGRLQHDYVGQCAQRDAAVAHVLAGSPDETAMEPNRPRPTGRLRWAVENASPAAALRSRTARPSGWPARPPSCPAPARTPAAGGWARRRRSRRAAPPARRTTPPRKRSAPRAASRRDGRGRSSSRARHDSPARRAALRRPRGPPGRSRNATPRRRGWRGSLSRHSAPRSPGTRRPSAWRWVSSSVSHAAHSASGWGSGSAAMSRSPRTPRAWK